MPVKKDYNKTQIPHLKTPAVPFAFFYILYSIEQKPRKKNKPKLYEFRAIFHNLFITYIFSLAAYENAFLPRIGRTSPR